MSPVKGKLVLRLGSDRIYFVENSPILNADRVRTPLFILHNPKDKVSVAQGRFLVQGAGAPWEAKVWLVSYDGEGHTLELEENRRDFSIRMAQFFDYYLKSKPPPKWMTEDDPEKLQDISAGLELDTSGKEP